VKPARIAILIGSVLVPLTIYGQVTLQVVSGNCTFRPPDLGGVLSGVDEIRKIGKNVAEGGEWR
jgi:hypothetical protein